MNNGNEADRPIDPEFLALAERLNSQPPPEISIEEIATACRRLFKGQPLEHIDYLEGVLFQYALRLNPDQNPSRGASPSS